MRRLTKLAFVFLFLMCISIVAVSAATLRIPEGNSWYNVSGARGKAYDSQANATIAYSTQGVLTASNYAMTISVHQAGGYRVSYNSTTKVGVELNTNFFTNTSAQFGHYHQVISNPGIISR